MSRVPVQVAFYLSVPVGQRLRSHLLSRSVKGMVFDAAPAENSKLNLEKLIDLRGANRLIGAKILTGEAGACEYLHSLRLHLDDRPTLHVADHLGPEDTRHNMARIDFAGLPTGEPFNSGSEIVISSATIAQKAMPVTLILTVEADAVPSAG